MKRLKNTDVLVYLLTVKTASSYMRLTWPRGASADNVDDVRRTAGRPEVAVAVGSPGENGMASSDWTALFYARLRVLLCISERHEI